MSFLPSVCALCQQLAIKQVPWDAYRIPEDSANLRRARVSDGNHFDKPRVWYVLGIGSSEEGIEINVPFSR